MTTLDLNANDISCAHCKNSIEHDLGETPGIRSVDVDVDTKAVRVDYDQDVIAPAAIRAKLDDIGYPAA